MSSASPGRYQSRLFNFVNQQSRRFKEKYSRSFRHLQVATKWSLQALFYPVYLLIQKAVESVGNQLQTAEPPSRVHLQGQDPDFQLEPPAPDIPIQRVLKAVENLPSASTLQLNMGVVQGIAAQLENRNLVLVSTKNEILDILTPQQQIKLEDRIISEVANYWHYLRITAVKNETALLPEIDRLLTKLTSGNTQEIPVLSEGATIEEKKEESIESQSLLETAPALAFLDTVVAELESNTLVPLSRVTKTAQQRGLELIQVAKTQFNIFLYGKQQSDVNGQLALPAGDLEETQTSKIKALIWGAINYFFGKDKGKKLEQTTSVNSVSNSVSQSLPRSAEAKPQSKRLPQSASQVALPTSQNLQDDDSEEDPWLSLIDLFGDSETVAEKLVVAAEKPNLALGESPSAEYSLPKWIHRFQIQILPAQPQQETGLVQRKKTTREITPTQKKAGKIAVGTETESRISQFESESNQGEISQQRYQSNENEIETNSDWIETKVTSVDYEKHFFEQLLGWLDSVMLLLEEILVKIFQALQRFWQGK
ncbi:MAG: hypothetical protein ACHBN1_08455 [Heteroscytonema crispum UTEX LB 1556]